MDKVQFELIRETVIALGYEHDIIWQRNVKDCNNSHDFICETIWVILNSGMKEQVARIIWNRILKAWDEGLPTASAFKYVGKVKAIDYVRENGYELFEKYKQSENKIEFLKTIPFIGCITCYHLAKNLGQDCVKPDRHIVRIAEHYKTTPHELCRRISEETGERIATVDIILWRASNLGIINTQNMNLTYEKR